ncbi:hypothetical protein HHK36_022479 [Tetracentron sinense]|uniref:Pre-mRNA-processing factor 19 n=1 Tax=Tetracentron sinense TaxID=13715 RepID=A0A834YUW6_TETSI|nr:hypothetical protein HHK36_022479 [Tetracentron sinense]
MQAVGIKKGSKQAKNRKRRIRRQRFRPQRRLEASIFHADYLMPVSEREKRFRAELSRGAKEDTKSRGLEKSYKEHVIWPTSNGPNQVDELISGCEAGLVELVTNRLEAQASSKQASSKVRGILQRNKKRPPPILKSSESRGFEAGGIECSGELVKLSSRVAVRSKGETPAVASVVGAKNQYVDLGGSSHNDCQGSKGEGGTIKVNSLSSASFSSPPGQFLRSRFWSDELDDRDYLESYTPLVFFDLATIPIQVLPLLESIAPTSQGEAEVLGAELVEIGEAREAVKSKSTVGPGFLLQRVFGIFKVGDGSWPASRSGAGSHDAACRVIARLKKERDEARSLLAQAERQIPMTASTAATANASALSNGKRAADDEELGPGGKKIRPGISADIISELTDCNATLSLQRKKRQIPPTLASVDTLERYTQLSSHPLHKTSKPGILSTDIHSSKDIIATGGVDTNAVIFDQTSGQILSTLSGHSKKVTSVKFVARDELFVTGSADKTVRVWQGSENGDYNCRHILKDHAAEVQAVTIHATNSYFVTASLDNTWCFYDLSSGLCLTQVGDASGSEGYTSAAFHPDGLILGTGTSEALVKIWDVKSQSNVARFDGHIGPVTAISFSENGYFLATAAHDGVKLWDLRKLRNFRTFTPYDSNTPTNSVDFDHSGSYLAIAGSDIRVYQVANVKSEWNCIKTFPDLSGTGKAACVKFGPDAKYLAVGSMDRNLRIFGLPGDGLDES